MRYLARGQYLLQQGVPVSDALVFCGEGAPNGLPKFVMPAGYDFDACDTFVLMNRLTAKAGRLYLPEGTSYPLLVLPDDPCMTPEVALKVLSFMQAGVPVIGPQPRRSPSLAGYPQCDAVLRDQLAGWNSVPNKKPETLLQELAIAPDYSFVSVDGAAKPRVSAIHRRTADAEIYFVACAETKATRVMASFRVSGKTPEVWDPDTGAAKPCEDWRRVGARTEVPIRFDPCGSVFVVFRQAEGQARGSTVAQAGPGWETVATVTGPWTVSFDRARGGPEQPRSFPALTDWSFSHDPAVRYYSGTASYRKTMSAPASRSGDRFYLDLGEVRNFAEVRMNGRDVGLLWKPPFRIEVTPWLKAGDNLLEISVTSTDVNRMIGDEELPPDGERDGPRVKGWPQWVLEGKASPTGRHTFMPWKLWEKGEALMPSGLLGPVMLLREVP